MPTTDRRSFAAKDLVGKGIPGRERNRGRSIAARIHTSTREQERKRHRERGPREKRLE